MATPWKVALERLRAIIQNDADFGKLKGLLLQKKTAERLEYFDDTSDEIVRETLLVLLQNSKEKQEQKQEQGEDKQQAGAPALTRDQVAALLRKKLPSPSSYAKNTRVDGWPDPKNKILLPLLRTHRPAKLSDDDIGQVPVTLLSPILARVEEDCAYAEPTAEDTDFALKLSLSMSEKFSDEEERRTTFCALLREEFGMPTQRLSIRDSLTDGTAVIESVGVYAMGLNVEVKQEVGTGGGDPRVQNSTYATLQAAENFEVLGPLTRCPAVLLELAGPNLSLSGFAFGEHASCDQLSQMVSLLYQPQSEIRVGAARVIHALRKAWPALKGHYEGLAQERAVVPVVGDQLRFPYQASYSCLDTGAEGHLLYVRRLTSLTFLARSGDRDVFVKFCKRYSTETHQVMATANCAPRLLGFQRLPGCWLMVVMEYLDDAVHWSNSMDKPTDPLKGAVKIMHDAGYVHGDLRSPNVLVKGGKVFIVDYEWAGKKGEVVYPLFMNRATESWPAGAADTQPILEAHDVVWLNKLVDEA